MNKEFIFRSIDYTGLAVPGISAVSVYLHSLFSSFLYGNYIPVGSTNQLLYNVNPVSRYYFIMPNQQL
jgi:hypothetical protein